MMNMQLYLYLLIWCQAAKTSKDQLTDLEQNVTINCDLDKNEVYWFLLKLPDSSAVILRSFSTPVPYYYNERFRHKYSVESKHNLFINNVTSEELGVYYCMSTDGDPKFSNGIRLHIIEPTPQTECQIQTVMQCIQHNQTSWQILALVSALFNAVLVVVVIGLLKICSVRRTTEQQFHNTGVQLTQDIQQHLDPNHLQHSEVDTSVMCTNIHRDPVNSTYFKLQLPK